MYNSFSVGDKVTLTESARRVNVEPEKYQTGVVVRVGSWNIYDVQWNGFERPIGMRGDEIQGGGGAGMSIFTEYDYQQMHVNAARMPLCVGKLRKIAHMDSNWEYYYNPQGGYCMAVAKPESGAETSTFGKISYVRQLVREGRIKPSALTKYGRRLLRV